MQDYSFDLERIFLGDMPLFYLFEIAFRSMVLFLYTLLMLRLIGHRGLSTLSLFEFGIIIALGSAVGDPMFYPEIPLLHGMMVITMIVILQRLLVWLTIHNGQVEDFIEGRPLRLVNDGILDNDGIRRARLTRDEVFAELRQEGAEHLGQIRRAYLEMDGEFSVFFFPKAEVRPGLPLLPREEKEVLIVDAGDKIPEMDFYACYHCGRSYFFEASATAPDCACEHNRWVKASCDLVPGMG